MSRCRSCDAPVMWGVTPAGKRMPLDPAPVDEAAAGLVAYSPSTGRAVVVKASDVAQCDVFRSRFPDEVRYHVAHWATCPNAGERRARAAQEAFPV